MNYKPNLPSSFYTRYKSRALLSSYMGRVSVKKCDFVALFGSSPLGTRGLLLLASNVGCVKYKTQTANKPNLKFKALTSLKLYFAQSCPFSPKFAYIIPATVQQKNLHGNGSNHNMQIIM